MKFKTSEAKRRYDYLMVELGAFITRSDIDWAEGELETIRELLTKLEDMTNV